MGRFRRLLLRPSTTSCPAHSPLPRHYLRQRPPCRTTCFGWSKSVWGKKKCFGWSKF
ncbi:hypothetical protein RHMOL_Rhmol06G0310400 [Rhododendron molle]|uniref:Uncharacterized protein n=1 Tax=Rhododendron molle TaxID=49168 RepID=A0ACC0NIF0_RHOML|nr:hypothetical protein RHMOL_Rhmol06G0310400 [Rhododendron molle]